MSRGRDIAALLRGLEKVRQAVFVQQQRELRRFWRNSSLRTNARSVNERLEERFGGAVRQQKLVTENVQNAVTGVVSGAEAIVKNITEQTAKVADDVAQKTGFQVPRFSKTTTTDNNSDVTEAKLDFDQEWQEILSQSAEAETSEARSQGQDVRSNTAYRASEDNSFVQSVKATSLGMGASGSVPSSRGAQFHYDAGAEEITRADLDADDNQMRYDKDEKDSNAIGEVVGGFHHILPVPKPPKGHRLSGLKPIAKTFEKELSREAKERRVPGSRLRRLASFGGLAAGLGVGAMAEITRRGFGFGKDKEGKNQAILDNNPFLTEANAERIVNTLCRVRGAALKLGQMLSIQDNSMINPELQRVFERVRQSADFMPTWQMEKALVSELGVNWRDKLSDFDDRPFAAASIGQVHKGTLLDGRNVAMKIQYPGVSDSINSDINNLMSIMNVWSILPQGMYVDSVMRVARRELAWECDYIREAQCSDRFRSLLKDDPVFYVPEVMWDLTTKNVLTTELVSGVSLDKLTDADQDTRNWICENMLRLCLSEVFEFNFMQTDPNWANFMYDKDTDRLTLLDFGASREYSKKFTDEYIRVIQAASVGNREGVVDSSRKLGFLTGHESKVMEKAHTEAVMILGEAFAHDEPFNFGTQSTASRINALVPIMLKHRLTPPPEETYSLHRKMAGCFLLCAKLNANILCKPMFDRIWTKYLDTNDGLDAVS